MRLDKVRAALAQRDAVYSMQTIIDEYGPLFGLDITKEDTPEIYSIDIQGIISIDNGQLTAKNRACSSSSERERARAKLKVVIK